VSRLFGTQGVYYRNGPSGNWANMISPWSVSCWVYPTAGRAQACAIVTTHYQSGYKIPLCLGYGPGVGPAGAQICWVGYFNGSAWYTTGGTGAATLPLNQWSHLVGQFGHGGTTSLRLYVNGYEAATNTTGIANVYAGADVYLHIGKRWDDAYGASDVFPGRIADVTIWKIALCDPSTNWRALALASGCHPLTLAGTQVGSDNLMGHWALGPGADGGANQWSNKLEMRHMVAVGGTPALDVHPAGPYTNVGAGPPKYAPAPFMGVAA
jgi:hypothetical protein